MPTEEPSCKRARHSECRLTPDTCLDNPKDPVPCRVVTMTSGRDTKDDSKADVVMEEYSTNPKDGVEDVETSRDAFGARKKVDPKEIALVRKIDWYMMVSSGNRILDSTAPANLLMAHPVVDVLFQLLGPQRHDQRQIELAGRRSEPAGHAVQHLRLHFVCRVSQY